MKNAKLTKKKNEALRCLRNSLFRARGESMDGIGFAESLPTARSLIQRSKMARTTSAVKGQIHSNFSRILAEFTALIHALVVGCLVSGWLLRGAWHTAYVALLIATILAQLIARCCPLTALENQFRAKQGEFNVTCHSYISRWGEVVLRRIGVSMSPSLDSCIGWIGIVYLIFALMIGAYVELADRTPDFWVHIFHGK